MTVTPREDPVQQSSGEYEKRSVRTRGQCSSTRGVARRLVNTVRIPPLHRFRTMRERCEPVTNLAERAGFEPYDRGLAILEAVRGLASQRGETDGENGSDCSLRW